MRAACTEGGPRGRVPPNAYSSEGTYEGPVRHIGSPSRPSSPPPSWHAPHFMLHPLTHSILHHQHHHHCLLLFLIFPLPFLLNLLLLFLFSLLVVIISFSLLSIPSSLCPSYSIFFFFSSSSPFFVFYPFHLFYISTCFHPRSPVITTHPHSFSPSTFPYLSLSFPLIHNKKYHVNYVHGTFSPQPLTPASVPPPQTFTPR